MESETSPFEKSFIGGVEDLEKTQPTPLSGDKATEQELLDRVWDLLDSSDQESPDEELPKDETASEEMVDAAEVAAIEAKRQERSRKRVQLLEFLSQKTTEHNAGRDASSDQESTALDGDFEAYLRLTKSGGNVNIPTEPSGILEDRRKRDHIRAFDNSYQQRDMAILLDELEQANKAHRIGRISESAPTEDEKWSRKQKKDATFIDRNQQWIEKRSIHKRELSNALDQAAIAECTFAPRLNHRSMALVRSIDRTETIQMGMGTDKDLGMDMNNSMDMTSYVKKSTRSTAAQRYKEAYLDREEEEQRECTFAPRLNKRSLQLVERSRTRLASFRPTSHRAEPIQSIPDDCTFQPNVHKISKRMKRASTYCSVNAFERLSRPVKENPFARKSAWVEQQQKERKHVPKRTFRSESSPNFEDFIKRQEKKLNEKLEKIAATKRAQSEIKHVGLTRESERIIQKKNHDFLTRQAIILQRRRDTVRILREELDEALVFKPEISQRSQKLALKSKYRTKPIVEKLSTSQNANMSPEERWRPRKKLWNRAHSRDVAHAKVKIEKQKQEEQLAAVPKRKPKSQLNVEDFTQRQTQYMVEREERLASKKWQYRDREEEEVMLMVKEKERIQRRQSNYFLKRVAVQLQQARLLDKFSNREKTRQLRSPTPSPERTKAVKGHAHAYTHTAARASAHVPVHAHAHAHAHAHEMPEPIAQPAMSGVEGAIIAEPKDSSFLEMIEENAETVAQDIDNTADSLTFDLDLSSDDDDQTSDPMNDFSFSQVDAMLSSEEDHIPRMDD